jgi:hypothetical protein
MRVVLQQIATKLYFQAEGKWTLDPGEARDFGSSLKAIDYCLDQKMSGVEVVLKFSEAKYDIRLSATARKQG